MLTVHRLSRALVERAQDPQNRDMWKSFVSSIGLLTVALLAALFSSTATRDHRVIEAIGSAALALGIAVWVCIRFVPRLAANVEWDWLPFFSLYRVTREGWIYCGSVLVVIFAAVNTNNNLLYMVLSALMAVLLLSGFLSSINFRSLAVHLRVPSHSFAGESFPISLEINNRKVIFPSFSLSVEPATDTSLRFKALYIMDVRAQAQGSRSGRATIPRRGRYEIGKVRLTSRYPFGFFKRGKDCTVKAECICYPEILPEEKFDLSIVDLVGSSPRFERGPGSDLYMIRDYLPSDSARHVHWKASAKTGTLKTREFAAEDSQRVQVYLDRFATADQNEEFEALVSYAASVATHLTRDGIDVALVSDEWNSNFGSTPKHLETILEYLALVERSNTICKSNMDSSDAAMVLSVNDA